MLKIFFSVTLVLLISFTSICLGQDNPCKTDDTEYVYNATLNKCYKFNLKPMNWSEAYESCVSDGAYLAILNSQAEDDFLIELIADAATDDVQGLTLVGAVYLGFFSFEVGRPFYTIKAEPLSETGFGEFPAGQPDNNRGPEVCGSMFTTGELNDIGCYWEAFSICEKDV